MLPEQLDRWNEHTLIRRVHTSQGRTKRNHVQVRIFLQEQAALQTCMDGLHLGILAKQAFVTLNGNLQNLRVGVGLPARIAIAMTHLGTTHQENCAHHGGDILFRRFSGAALTCT